MIRVDTGGGVNAMSGPDRGRGLFRWCGAVAQLGERVVRNDEVSGSIPLSSTIAGFENSAVRLYAPGQRQSRTCGMSKPCWRM